MVEILSALHAILRTLHIVGGTAGLALFWVILALPKGSRTHVRCGKAFAVIVWIVGGSAVVSCAWALVHPDSFARIAPDAANGEALRETYRFIFAVLLYLSLATMTGALFGTKMVRERASHEALRRTSLPLWIAVTGTCAAGLAAFGAWMLATKGSTGGMPWAAYFVPVAVGGIGVAVVVAQWRYVFGPAPGGAEWLYQHVRNMCGTGVAFHTAFLVFGANRIFAYQLPGAWALIPWVGPPVIGMTLTAIYVRRLRRGSRMTSPMMNDA